MTWLCLLMLILTQELHENLKRNTEARETVLNLLPSLIIVEHNYDEQAFSVSKQFKLNQTSHVKS